MNYLDEYKKQQQADQQALQKQSQLQNQIMQLDAQKNAQAQRETMQLDAQKNAYDAMDLATEYDNYKKSQNASNGTTATATQGATQNATQQAQKGTDAAYENKWNAELDGIMNQIMNREKFSYDMNGDAMYQQFKDQYIQQANLANQNAQAMNASLTGGYGSSYSQMAGQQAYAQQMQGLNDKSMELYQNALNQYMMEGDQLNNQYSMLANREAQDYARYMDDKNFNYQKALDEQAQANWQAELDRALANDAQAQANYEKSFEYQQGRDTIADQQWDKSFSYQQSQDQLAQDNYMREFQYMQDQDRLAQDNYMREWQYMQEQDKLNQQNYEKEFDYKQKQDQLAQDNYLAELQYMQKQDKLAQDNYLAEFQYKQKQDIQEQKNWDALYGENGLYNKTTPTSVTYYGGGTMQGKEVPVELQNIPGLTTTDITYFDSNGNFKKAELLGETADGKMSFRIGGQTVTLDRGTNPYTKTYNPDCENGTFSNGYQPNNVNGSKLTKTGETEYVNGVEQNVWKDEQGNTWVWDGTQNKYIDV